MKIVLVYIPMNWKVQKIGYCLELLWMSSLRLAAEYDEPQKE